MEHFQWKSPEEIKKHIIENKEEIGEELSDVFNWVLILAHDLGIDIKRASEKKIAKNGLKYPVEKAKGRADKYAEL